MEKTICPLPYLKFALNSIKTVCVPVKPQRIISARLATRRYEYFAEDYLSTVFGSSFVMKIHIQKKWEKASFSFEKPNKTSFFLRSSFQSSLLKHAGEVRAGFKSIRPFFYNRATYQRGPRTPPTTNANLHVLWKLLVYSAGAEPCVF